MEVGQKVRVRRLRDRVSDAVVKKLGQTGTIRDYKMTDGSGVGVMESCESVDVTTDVDGPVASRDGDAGLSSGCAQSQGSCHSELNLSHVFLLKFSVQTRCIEPGLYCFTLFEPRDSLREFANSPCEK